MKSTYHQLALFVLAVLVSASVRAQDVAGTGSQFVKKNDAVLTESNRNDVVWENKDNSDRNILNHLAVALTLGTTGVGFDLAMPIGNYVQLRAGYAVVPSFKHDMDFTLQVGDKEEKKYDEQGNRVETKFEKLANIFNQVTGYEVNEEVSMIGRPTMDNAKLLIDVFPFRNKKWFFTAGFYYGKSKVARAYNHYEDMKVLFSVDMYNQMYDKVMNAYNDPYNPFHDVILFEKDGAYVKIPSEQADELHKYMSRYGRMGIHLGDYFLVPDEDGMVKATVRTNSFRPYLGFGFGNAVPKGDKKYGFMLEAGAMFWGGTPKVDCYGTDLVDMHVRGRVGHYVDAISLFKVFPVINLRITRRLF